MLDLVLQCHVLTLPKLQVLLPHGSMCTVACADSAQDILRVNPCCLPHVGYCPLKVLPGLLQVLRTVPPKHAASAPVSEVLAKRTHQLAQLSHFFNAANSRGVQHEPRPKNKTSRLIDAEAKLELFNISTMLFRTTRYSRAVCKSQLLPVRSSIPSKQIRGM